MTLEAVPNPTEETAEEPPAAPQLDPFTLAAVTLGNALAACEAKKPNGPSVDQRIALATAASTYANALATRDLAYAMAQLLAAVPTAPSSPLIVPGA